MANLKQELNSISFKEISNYFKKKTPKNIPTFEARPSQNKMIEGVTKAFNNNALYLCEAPTGVGKSLAYLLPAIEWILKNKEKVVISTHTIYLQEQLFFKDIPKILEINNTKIKYALIKGRKNYLCTRKFEEYQKEPNSFFNEENELSNQINVLKSWTNETKTGDFSELPFALNPILNNQFSSEVDTCKIINCHHKTKCFYHKARKNCFEADLLIVNHHLLCADMNLKKKIDNDQKQTLLPHFKRLIIDEAHHLEETAINHFGMASSNTSIKRSLNLIGKVSSKKKIIKGALIKLESHLKKNIVQKQVPFLFGAKLFKEYKKEILDFIKIEKEISKQIYQYFAAFKRNEEEINIRINNKKNEETWINNYKKPLETFLFLLERIKKTSINIHQFFSKYNPETIKTILLDLQAYIGRIEESIHVFKKSLEDTKQNEIKWISIKKLPHHQIYFSIHLTPLLIQKEIREVILKNLKTIIITSATISDEEGFDFFKKRMGIDAINPKKIFEEKLSSNFNYEKNCLLFIPNNLPEPSDKLHTDYLFEYIMKAIDFFKGRTFILFTSYQQMLMIKKKVEIPLKKKSIELLLQGEANRMDLVNRFKNNPHAVLMGVNSFWEGVDIQGENLSCLIMTKIPFSVPTDPIHEAHIELLKKEGKNAFYEYSLPTAIIKFRQGFGRLIRGVHDRGLFIVLDCRLKTKAYGSHFLKCLPPKLKRMTGNNLEEAAKVIFNQKF